MSEKPEKKEWCASCSLKNVCARGGDGGGKVDEETLLNKMIEEIKCVEQCVMILRTVLFSLAGILLFDVPATKKKYWEQTLDQLANGVRVSQHLRGYNSCFEPRFI